MGTTSENTTDIEEAKVIPMMSAEQELMQEEDDILLKAQAIQKKRDAEYKAEEAKILAELESEYGLSTEKLDECKEAEKSLGDPEKNVKTLTDAMHVYQDAGLSKEQLAFMAINSNSRANMNIRQVEFLQKEVEGAQKQVEALMKLSAMTNGVKEMMPPGPEDKDGNAELPPESPGLESENTIEK